LPYFVAMETKRAIFKVNVIFCTTLLPWKQKRAKAQNLLDRVFDHLELIEKDYFGLQFLDLAPDPDTIHRDKMVCSLLIVAWAHVHKET